MSELDCYDAGLLGDGGGGDVEWWQDYIRAELGRAHDFYQSQIPEGYKLVPVEPTEAMIERGNEMKYQKAEYIYKAMLEAVE